MPTSSRAAPAQGPMFSKGPTSAEPFSRPISTSTNDIQVPAENNHKQMFDVLAARMSKNAKDEPEQEEVSEKDKKVRNY
jgi:hypothetical protein